MSITSSIQYAQCLNNKDKKTNETHVYRNPQAIGEELNSFCKDTTIQQQIKELLKNPDKNIFGIRKKQLTERDNHFTWYTRQEIINRAEAFGSGLYKLGLITFNEWKDYKFNFIGISAKTSLEYMIFDLSCIIYDITSVPLYDNLGEDGLESAIKETKSKTLIVNQSRLKSLKEGKEKGLFQNLENIIIIENQFEPQDLIDSYKEYFQIYNFQEVEEVGKKKIMQWKEVNPNSIYAFCYTSGTTGEPKASMLSHRHFCLIVESLKEFVKLEKGDYHLCYLPMAHIFQRAMVIIGYFNEFNMGIYSGDISTLFEDIKILQPNVMICVPRILNKLYDQIQNSINTQNFIAKQAFQLALRNKQYFLRRFNFVNHFLYDRTIFYKTKNIFGGRLRILITGSAPIDPTIINFLRVTCCTSILEVYGQTEGSGLEFMTKELDQNTSGHVGGPSKMNEFKLVDVPELEYFATDKNQQGESQPRGEIWVRGPNVIKEYFKKEKDTNETFSQDGWLLTGDIGELNIQQGCLKIIDRKKNIFKLSQGVYITPEKLENCYQLAHSAIQNIFVYGNSLKSSLIAVVEIPQNEYDQELKELSEIQDKDKILKEKILESLEQCRIQKNFSSLEKIKDVIITTDDWQQLNLLTSTMKKKRNKLAQYYMTQINEAYKKLDQLIIKIYQITLPSQSKQFSLN